MVAFDEDLLGTAEFGKNYKDQAGKFGGAGHSYLGSFQMGRGAWTDAGGDGAQWDQARKDYQMSGMQYLIGYNEQLDRARTYWGLCGATYLGWNLGLGNATKLYTAASLVPPPTIEMLGLCVQCRGQAYARGIDCNVVTCVELIARAEAYYLRGKPVTGQVQA
jgi:hypothetical protein